MQEIIFGKAYELRNILKDYGTENYLLVCDSSIEFLNIREYLPGRYVEFSGFTPNPVYTDVCKGVEIFNTNKCDAIVAIGGGSSIDVAKCIKLFCRMNSEQNYLEQEYKDNGIPLIALPTTAGTGSESTRFAVIYYEGKKQSISSDYIIPDHVILDHGFLKTLPLYQKKCTMLDALCQGIESWWSVNSTDKSKEYSKIAVETIITYMYEYIEKNSDKAAEKIMAASNYSGRAINITQTTAAHAMSYKLTSIYGLPHGHAVALCFPEVWKYMLENPDNCIDKRGTEYLMETFHDISSAFGNKSPQEAIEQFRSILNRFGIFSPDISKEELSVLTSSVNPIRLKNNPVYIPEDDIYTLYENIRGNKNET